MSGKKQNGIAVVGMACRYPDAHNPQQLWENILAKRISFRKIPVERLADAYFSEDASDLDATYSYKAAVLKNYSFPREKYKISKSVFETADFAHWLALDVASQAIEDANFKSLDELKKLTGVFVGNTLTGEFSRANLLRLRWPYVSKVLIKQMQEEGWESERIEKFINETEARFKSPFPVMTEDSLSGGLSNTIAGRICNYFDFNGGGYTVDGACSSSLLAISNACNAIASGDLSIAITGGVDLSLDPFELVGFARAGALAKKKMLVYDKNSAGFLPGEGCGFLVLMNYKEAIAQGLNIYAVINGWGISSDGQGGLTRPTTHGQLLSFDRAYKKAGYHFNDIGYIEGHGTGTKVGDETELNTISEAINSATADGTIFLGSVKANIGHTKAAAGIAGLIKAILCVQRQTIPPATGNKEVHPLIAKNINLQLSREGKLWDAKKDLKAAVSSMGFGGINTHVTLSSLAKTRKKRMNVDEQLLLSSSQSAELFLFSSDTIENLKQQVQSVLNYAYQLSFAELIDLSFALHKNLSSGKYRVSIIADEPNDLVKKLQQVVEHIESEKRVLDLSEGIFFSQTDRKSKIGFLFPGQGTSNATQSNFIQSRFPDIKNNHFDSADKEGHSTKQHQTDVVNRSIHALKLLDALNIKADVAIGHSLGEITALYWAGVYSQNDLIRLVKFRGELMKQCHGSMLSVNCDLETIKSIITNREVSLACINTGNQLVLSGSDDAIAAVQQELKQKKIAAVKLGVSGAFHSPLMKPLQEPFDNFLKNISFQSPKRKIISTVLGRKIEKDHKIKELLVDQFLHPVQFVNAIEQADDKIDFWIEVGAGKTLTAMAASTISKPIVSVDAGSNDISELLKIVALNFIFNKEYNADYLFKNRFHRTFDLDWKAEFLSNPCEHLVIENIPVIKRNLAVTKEVKYENVKSGDFVSSFKEILSQHLELPSASLNSKAKMLDDLHLNSITVGQLLAQVSKQFNIAVPTTPTEYSNASIEEIAGYFESAAGNETASKASTEISGLHDWIKVFSISLNEEKSVQKEIKSTNESSWMQFVAGEPENELLQPIKSLPCTGVIVSLFSDNENETIETLVKSIQCLTEKKNIEHYVVIQNKNMATGFAKSIHLEKRNLKVTVITLNDTVDAASIRNDVFFNKGFVEVVYKQGKRFVPELKLIDKIKPAKTDAVNASDVVLVTGGGKGITAECALALAKKTKCRLLLVGRTERSRDEKLNNNLARFDAGGVNYLYEIVDLNNKEQLAVAVSKARKAFGEITSIIHGAGINNPVSITNLDIDKIKGTVSPKLHGLQNCLAAVDESKLKSLFTFGSIIASSGMQGNADYALANEWMRNEVLNFQSKFPKCKCLNLEWSVWSGAGMGENLNVLEQLVSSGISPISLDNGVNEFLNLIGSDLPSSSVIVAGRFGNLPTLAQVKVELPLLRFLEDIKVFYPGIEIISDFVLSGINDPYLADHAIKGNYIFPGVVGLEAMMQAASVLMHGTGKAIVIRDVQFLQAITLYANENLNVRVLAVKNNMDEVHASIRCETTNFLVDHFKAKFSFADVVEKSKPLNGKSHTSISMNANEVYENLLFHTGRFRCLKEYKSLTPYSCTAFTTSNETKGWYGNYFSQTNLLGNPAVRDAMLHAVQACVPIHTLLPISAKEILVFKVERSETMQIEAVELYRDNMIFCYTIILKNAEGEICEAWNEVKFSVLKSLEPKRINFAFAQIALQRKADEMKGSKTVIDFCLDNESRSEGVLKRADGKPFLIASEHVSISKHKDVKLMVKSENKTGCDVEQVNNLDKATWTSMLGKEKSELASFVSVTLKEDFSISATRVWGAMECLKKAGENLMSSITYDKTDQDGFVIFNSADKKIISYRASLNEFDKKSVFSILL